MRSKIWHSLTFSVWVMFALLVPNGAIGQDAFTLASGIDGNPSSGVLTVPAGLPPFPLAVMTHGSDEDAGRRRAMRAPDYPFMRAALLALGYAVLELQRPGHGATPGPYAEGQGWCANADFYAAGMATARIIMAGVAAMQGTEGIADSGAVIIGNSAGGWGALAAAGLGEGRIAGIVNVSGGRGGRNEDRADNNCSPETLISTAGRFGAQGDVPTLWLYAENDTYFPPHLSRAMFDAFISAGGDGRYVLLPSVPGDGHALISTSADAGGWGAPLKTFLMQLR